MSKYHPPIAEAMRAKGFYSQFELRQAMEAEIAKNPKHQQFLNEINFRYMSKILHGDEIYSEEKEDSAELLHMLLIAAVLGCGPEKLFPLKKKGEDPFITEADIRNLYDFEWPVDDPYDIQNDIQIRTGGRAVVERALDRLDPRESLVLRLRFENGLELKECGLRLNVTGERIRQIEAKALRILRHPSRSGELREFFDIMDDPDRFDGVREINALRAAGKPFFFPGSLDF